MPITAQQFDLVARIQGMSAALDLAQRNGGVIGLQESGGTTFDQNAFGGLTLSPTSLAASGAAPAFQEPPAPIITSQQTAPSPPAAQSGDEASVIAAWVRSLESGALGIDPAQGTAALLASLGQYLHRTVTVDEFNRMVMPGLSAKWQDATSGPPTGGGFPGEVGMFPPGSAVPGPTRGGGFPGEPVVGGRGGLTGTFGRGPQPGPPGAVGSAEGIPTPGIRKTGGLGDAVPSPEFLTERALRTQPDVDVYRRVGEEIFGPRSPLQARILSHLINRFEQQSPITQFGQSFGADERPERFRQFVRAPELSGLELGGRLANIIGTADPKVLQGAFTRVDEEGLPVGPLGGLTPAFRAGIAPFLTRMSPFIRQGVTRALEDEFEQLYARDPTQFQRPQDIFSAFQRRKFLPTYESTLQGF